MIVLYRHPARRTKNVGASFRSQQILLELVLHTHSQYLIFIILNTRNFTIYIWESTNESDDLYQFKIGANTHNTNCLIIQACTLLLLLRTVTRIWQVGPNYSHLNGNYSYINFNNYIMPGILLQVHCIHSHIIID